MMYWLPFPHRAVNKDHQYAYTHLLSLSQHMISSVGNWSSIVCTRLLYLSGGAQLDDADRPKVRNHARTQCHTHIGDHNYKSWYKWKFVWAPSSYCCLVCMNLLRIHHRRGISFWSLDKLRLSNCSFQI